MKILIDIGHPAHVHFFRFPIKILLERNHDVQITARDKDCALDLVKGFKLPFKVLSRTREGALGLARELFMRDLALYRHIKRLKPDIMAGIGGIFIAHAGLAARIPSLVFYDTENARLQNALTYPFASAVIVPRCYSGWLPKARHVRYPGYHELSYLRPPYFRVDPKLAIKSGLAKSRDTFLVRVVSWKANHDLGKRGWTEDTLKEVVQGLQPLGKVIISSEGPLPDDLEQFGYKGRKEDIHHLMGFCRLYVGESATMASEAAVLGVPAIYAASAGLDCPNEQERRYGLVKNVRNLTSASILSAAKEKLHKPRVEWTAAKNRLLADTSDVARMVADCIEKYPRNPTKFFRQPIEDSVTAKR